MNNKDNKEKIEELLELLEKHKTHITSTSEWERYRRGKKLPHFQTLISHFGSWNNLKELLGLNLNEQYRPLKYTDEDLIEILEKHKDNYTSAAEWDKFARVHNFPKHALFLDRLGFDLLSKYATLKIPWTVENIKECILKHFPFTPPSAAEWNALREDNPHLPTTTTIIRKYNGWNQMKLDIYGQI